MSYGKTFEEFELIKVNSLRPTKTSLARSRCPTTTQRPTPGHHTTYGTRILNIKPTLPSTNKSAPSPPLKHIRKNPTLPPGSLLPSPLPEHSTIQDTEPGPYLSALVAKLIRPVLLTFSVHRYAGLNQSPESAESRCWRSHVQRRSHLCD